MGPTDHEDEVRRTYERAYGQPRDDAEDGEETALDLAAEANASRLVAEEPW